MMNLENKKQLATLALAVGLGFVAVFLTGEYLRSSINTERKKLADEYKKSQAALAQEMEKRISFLKQEMDKQKQEFEQRLKEQPRGAGKLSKEKGAGGEGDKGVVSMAAFSVKTPPGKRALTVMIDSLSAVGGLINPGDFVDIIAHLQIPTDPKFLIEGASGKSKDKKVLPTTTVLFQNLQILAVDTNFKVLDEQAPNYAVLQKARSINVTLAVTPQEATLLTFAQANGQLQLMLRSPAEQDTIKMGVASWDSLAEFLMQHQGTQLSVPQEAAPLRMIQPVEEGTEATPFIEIFKSGKQTK